MLITEGWYIGIFFSTSSCLAQGMTLEINRTESAISSNETRALTAQHSKFKTPKKISGKVMGMLLGLGMTVGFIVGVLVTNSISKRQFGSTDGPSKYLFTQQLVSEEPAEPVQDEDSGQSAKPAEPQDEMNSIILTEAAGETEVSNEAIGCTRHAKTTDIRDKSSDTNIELTICKPNDV